MDNFKDKLIEAKKQQQDSDIEYAKDPDYTSKSWHIGDLITDAMDPPGSDWDRDGQIEKLERQVRRTQALAGRLMQVLYERKLITTEELEEITD